MGKLNSILIKILTMVNAYSIPQAKGLYSAVFIQYFIYAMLYTLEGAKIKEIKEAEREREKKNHEPVSGNSNYTQNMRIPATEEKL